MLNTPVTTIRTQKAAHPHALPMETQDSDFTLQDFC
jgi:hypothetical protein